MQLQHYSYIIVKPIFISESAFYWAQAESSLDFPLFIMKKSQMF